MYYEERMIGGKLKYRNEPDAKWREVSIEKAWDRIIALQDEINELRACMKTSANMLNKYTSGG